MGSSIPIQRSSASASSILLVLIYHVLLCGCEPAQGNSGFSYDPDAETGPAYWPYLDTNPYENECAGKQNSPISFRASDESSCAKHDGDYKFNSGTCPLNQLNYFSNDRSVQANFPAAAAAEDDDDDDGSYNNYNCTPPSFSMPDIDGIYQMTQFHIHTSSEHLLLRMESTTFDFELHFVHQLLVTSSGSSSSSEGTNNEEGSVKNSLAVVAVWLSGSGTQRNAAFDVLLDQWSAYYESEVANCSDSGGGGGGGRYKRMLLPRQLRQSTALTNIYDLFYDTTSVGFLHYSGGLTTPPCTQDVWWNVASQPIIISVAQKEELNAIILSGYFDADCSPGTVANPITNSTSRPVQPRNGRTVVYYCGKGSGQNRTTLVVVAILRAVSVLCFLGVASFWVVIKLRRRGSSQLERSSLLGQLLGQATTGRPKRYSGDGKEMPAMS